MSAGVPPARWHALADAGARAAYAALWGVAETTPFASLAFADAACAAYGFRGSLVLAGDAGAPDAGLVVYEKRVGPLRAAALPPYAQFVSPVLRSALDPASVHARASPLDALAAALQVRLHQAALRPDPWLVDARPLAWAGWRLTTAYHTEAEITGEDGKGRWSRSTRRRARRHAAEFEIRSGPEQIPAAVALAAQSHTSKGLGHPPRDSVERLARALVEAGMAEAFVAAPATGGAAEAGLVMAWHGERAHYWVVGSEPGPAMAVLVGHATDVLRARGVRRVHFGGANTPSVAEFKRNFGWHLVPVVRARWVGPRWLRALDALRPG